MPCYQIFGRQVNHFFILFLVSMISYFYCLIDVLLYLRGLKLNFKKYHNNKIQCQLIFYLTDFEMEIDDTK